MKNIILMALGGVVILAGVVALAWWGMGFVPAGWARLWALAATVALPFVAWAGWWFGHTEARGIVRGLDKGVDKMFGGLSQAAGLRVNTTRAMRHVAREVSPVVVLPDVEIVSRQLSGGSIIDL